MGASQLNAILWDWWNQGQHGISLPKNICDADQIGVTRYVREHILKRLGKPVRGKVVPKTAEGRFVIDGHTFVLLAHKPSASGWKTAKHRMLWQAPDGSLIPTGRINMSYFCGYKGPRRSKRGPGGRFVRSW
jgi:hypothetical protein